MSFFDFIFGGDEGYVNPADSASQYFEKIPGVVKPYLDPYIEEGKRASEVNNPLYESMSRDPNDFLNAIMRNYSPSEGYKYKERNLNKVMRNAAAQGGYSGTPYDQEQQSTAVNGLLSQDMQQFLENIFGVQGRGLSGNEDSINRGFKASNSLADILGGNLAQLGNLSFQGQSQINQNMFDKRSSNMDFINNLIGTGVKAYGMGMFGGANKGYGVFREPNKGTGVNGYGMSMFGGPNKEGFF
jgi:hypothetical protein